MADLGIIILTHNEERHIERAIRSVNSLAREVVVVDSLVAVVGAADLVSDLKIIP